MTKKIRFPLIMKNGAEVRSLEELQENFDLESVLGYFADGRLKTWLTDRYYDEKAEAIGALSTDMSDLNARICAIFGVECEQGADETDIELIQRRNEKLRILNEITADKDILDNVDCIYRSDCPLCTDFLPTLAASAHGAAHKLNNILAI